MKKLDIEQIELIKTTYERLKNISRTANALNMSYSTVHRYALNKTYVSNVSTLKLVDYNMDARRKLTDDDIERIKILYKQHRLNMRALARLYNVSCVCIKYHLDENFKRTNNQRSIANAHKYMTKEQHNECSRRTYEKKKRLLEDLKNGQKK